MQKGVVDGNVLLYSASPRVNEYSYSNRNYEPPDYYGDPMFGSKNGDHFLNNDFNLLPYKGNYMTRSPYILYGSSYGGFNPTKTSIQNAYGEQSAAADGAAGAAANATSDDGDIPSLEDVQSGIETVKEGWAVITSVGGAISDGWNNLTGSPTKEQAEARRKNREARAANAAARAALWAGKDITGGWLGQGENVFSKGNPVHVSELTSSELMDMLNNAKAQIDSNVKMPIKRNVYEGIIKGNVTYRRNLPRHKHGVRFFMAADELLKRGEILENIDLGIDAPIPSGTSVMATSSSGGISGKNILIGAAILGAIGFSIYHFRK